MIWEWIGIVLDSTIGAVIRLVPESSALPLPNLGVLGTYIGQIDSLVPIAAPIALWLVLLAGLGGFLIIRAAVLVWQQLPFT